MIVNPGASITLNVSTIYVWKIGQFISIPIFLMGVDDKI